MRLSKLLKLNKNSNENFINADEIINDYCKNYKNQHFSIQVPEMLFLEHGGIEGVCCEHTDEFAKIRPNVIIYNKFYVNCKKIPATIKNTVQFIIKFNGNVYSPLLFNDPECHNVYTGVDYKKLFWTLNYIENDIENDHKHNKLRNICRINIYAAHIPVTDDMDLIEVLRTDLIPKLTENNVEII